MFQNLYNLVDMAVMTEVIDSRAFSRFCGVESSNQIPDGNTIGRFRNILTKNGLQEQLFADLVETLKKNGLILMKGTIVDSTLIAAAPSTKNKEKTARPGGAPEQKGQELTLRLQGAYRGRPGCRTRASRRSHSRERERRSGNESTAEWYGRRGLRRQRVYRR